MAEVASPISPTQAMESLSLESPNGSTHSTPYEPLTVFHDPKNFNVKHPLMNTWTLWFTKTPSASGPKENWADLLKEVITFDSVEEFWGIFNNISKTSEIPLKSDYALFKRGVRPEWEDSANEKGGKWSYQFKRNAGIDELWLYTMLAAIGETLEKEGDDEVMGVVVNARKGFYRIGLWTKSCSNAEILRAIGKRFKEVLKLPEPEKVEFNAHSDSERAGGSSRAKSRMVV